MILAVLFETVIFSTSTVLAAAKCVALVIGNPAYSDVGTLVNPIEDATAVSQAFENAGFYDVRHLHDLSADAMRQELKAFSGERSPTAAFRCSSAAESYTLIMN